jgi:hypothetical protein
MEYMGGHMIQKLLLQILLLSLMTTSSLWAQVVADALEPNDDAGTATVVPLLLDGMTYSVENLTIHNGGADEDHFQLQVLDPDVLFEFVMTNNDASDALSFSLSGSNTVSAGRSTTNKRYLSAGTYDATIKTNSVEIDDYSFSFTSRTYFADANEPNNTIIEATDLGSLAADTTSLSDLTIYAGTDVDMYAFTLDADMVFQMAIPTKAPSAVLVGSFILDSNGDTISTAANVAKILTAGDYYLGIYARTTTDMFFYDLDLIQTPLPCPEPTNSTAEACEISDDVTPLSFSDGSDLDYFSFTLTRASNVVLYASTGVTLELWEDPDADLAALDVTTSSSNRIDTLMAAGTYYIIASSTNSVPMETYTLVMNQTQVAITANEPNEDISDAVDLGVVDADCNVPATLLDQTLHSLSDVDMYSFVSLGTCILAPRSSYLVNTAQVEMLDADQNPVDYEPSVPFDNEYMNGLPAGQYYIRINGAQNSLDDRYWMAIKASVPNPVDEYETDNSFAVAHEIIPGDTLSANFSQMSVFETDTDNVYLDLDAYYKVNLVVWNDSARWADHSIFIWSDTTAEEADFDVSGQQVEAIVDEEEGIYSYTTTTQQILAPGRHYIQLIWDMVTDYNDNYRYKMLVTLEEMPQPDALEFNDSFEDATVLEAVNQYIGDLNILDDGADEDYFVFTLDDSAYVHIGLRSNGASTDLELWTDIEDAAAYSEDVRLVSSSNAENVESSSIYEVLPAGTYYFRVREEGMDANIASYDLVFEVMPQDICEENDEVGSPCAIDLAQDYHFYVDPYDRYDYFSITTTDSSLVTITLDIDDSVKVSEIAAAISGESWLSHETIGNEHTYTYSLASGTYTLNVSRTFSYLVGYGLRIEEAPTVVADAYEENDDYTTATAITNGDSLEALTIHNNGTDVDVFAFTLDVPSEVYVTVEENSAMGVIARDFLDSNGVASDRTTYFPAGTWYLVLSEVDQNMVIGEYGFSITIVDQLLNDELESNNVAELATEINDGDSYSNLNLTNYTTPDRDYFSFVVTETSNLTIALTAGDADYTTIQLVDADGTSELTSTASNGAHSFESTLASGTYYFYIAETGSDAAVESYDLSFSLQALATADAYELNNTQSSATPLVSGDELTNLTIHSYGNDVDYFVFTADEESEMTFSLSASSISLVVRLLSDAGAELQSQTISADAELSATLDAGDYYIEISEEGQDEEVYDYGIGLMLAPVPLSSSSEVASSSSVALSSSSIAVSSSAEVVSSSAEVASSSSVTISSSSVAVSSSVEVVSSSAEVASSSSVTISSSSVVVSSSAEVVSSSAAPASSAAESSSSEEVSSSVTSPLIALDNLGSQWMVQNGVLQMQVQKAGQYQVEIYNAQGLRLQQESLYLDAGVHQKDLALQEQGLYIISVIHEGARHSVRHIQK